MAILLPTAANTRLLKSILMGDLSMRSAHASEAIASLLGYRSNAAMLALEVDVIRSSVHEVDFMAFEARCATLGYDAISSEYLRTIFTSLDWPEPVWKLVSKRDVASRNTWFHECELRRIPFVCITRARKYCSVSWDHASMDSDYDDEFRRSFGDEAGRIFFRIYQAIAAGLEPRSYFEGSAQVGDITGLSEASARQIANAFAGLLFPGNLRRSSELT